MARKRSPNGTIKAYKMKDGRYGVAVDLGRDQSGKRIRPIKTGKTEQEAIDKMRRWLSQNGYLETEETVINGQSTARELVKAFKLKNLLASGISDSTYENYGYALKHFETYFEDRRLCMIDANEMTRFFNTMANTVENGDYKYGKCSLDRAEYITNRMFEWAVEEEYLSCNPMASKRFKMPKANKSTTPITALSENDLDLIEQALYENKILYPIILLMSKTGMRTEEALALHWEDIDFDKEEIYIHRAIIKKNVLDENGNKVRGYTTEGTTKRGTGDRVIYPSEEVFGVLKKWREIAPQISKTKTGNQDYVFGNTKDVYWSCDGLRSSVNRCLKNSGVGIDRLRLHRLRHTVATRISEDPDATVYDIMYLLGHKQIKTAQRYIDIDTANRRMRNKKLMSRMSESKEQEE